MTGDVCYYVYQTIRCEFCARVINVDRRVYMMYDKPFCCELCRERHRHTYAPITNNNKRDGNIPSSLVDLYLS